MDSSTTRRLTVRVKEEGSGASTKRHVNVDNVSYLQVLESEPTATGGALFLGAPVAVGLFGFLNAGIWVALAGSVLTLLFLGAFVHMPEGVEIGTVNEALEVDESNSDELEDQFTSRVGEVITLAAEHRILLEKTTYRYHFVPDNIVSVRQGGGLTLSLLGVIGFVIAFMSALSGSVGGITIGAVLGLVGYWLPADSYTLSPTRDLLSRNSLFEGSSSFQSDSDGVLSGLVNGESEKQGILVRRCKEGPEELNVTFILGALICLHSVFALSVLELLVGVGVMVGSFFIPGVAVSDGVDIETKGGYEKSFYMSSEDASDLLSAFGTRQ